MKIERIVSGGQTGVDRAALDVARQLQIPHGGWCPLGRLAEDGRIPDEYQLAENSSTEYAVRTEQNVLDSDATLILYHERLQGGTLLTSRLARKHQRPLYQLDLSAGEDASGVRRWLAEHRVQVLNVAGPRESSTPGIGERARGFLRQLLAVRQRPSCGSD